MDRVRATVAALSAALVVGACGGTAQRDSTETAAGGSTIGGQSGGGKGGSGGGQLGTGGGSSGRSGQGGRAGAAASGAAGVAVDVDAGSPQMDAGTDPDVIYRAVITNAINSGEFVTFTRADSRLNTCFFFTTFVQVGSAPEPVMAASAFFDAANCCPYDSSFAAFCDGNAGCPTSSSVSGSIGGTPATGFDIDLTFEFSEVLMWLPPVVQFRTTGLEYSNCN